jgi:membrane-associated phospholipid phosphatase
VAILVPVRAGDVAVVLGGAVLLVVSWVVVAGEERVPAWEARVFDEVNGWPDGLWRVFWGPMQLGSLLGSFAVVAVIQLVGRDGRLSLAALAASLVAWSTAKGVKALVARARPAALLHGVHVREQTSGLGYVSGHAAVAFALAAVLAPSLPRSGRVAVFVVATVVGLARLYAGAHLPLDVIGGAGLGLLSGTLSRWAFGMAAVRAR